MPARARRVPPDDRGAAVVEFTLVSILLVTLFVMILQFGLVLHTRNVMVSAAQEGARFAANADRSAADGIARTEQALRESLGSRILARTQVTQAAQTTTASGAPVVGIRVQGPLPFLFAAVGPLEITVEGHALDEGGAAVSRLRGEDGNALVEFTYLAVLLMVPLVYVLTTVFQVQRAAFGVTEAARQAGRAYVTADSDAQGRARAQEAADLAMRDQIPGFGRAQVSFPRAEFAAGGTVTVVVRHDVTLPILGGLFGEVEPRIPVDATHVEVVDRFREVG